VQELSRAILFGSTACLNIRDVEHFPNMSKTSNSAACSATSERLFLDTLDGCQFLMSYAGGGTFVCITKRAARSQAFGNEYQHFRWQTELFDNRGRAYINTRTVPVRLVRFDVEDEFVVMDALSEAQCSAKKAQPTTKRSQNTNFGM